VPTIVDLLHYQTISLITANPVQSPCETSTSIMADNLLPGGVMPNEAGNASAEAPQTMHEHSFTEVSKENSAEVNEGENSFGVITNGILSTEEKLNHSEVKHESLEPLPTSPATSDHEVILPGVAPVTATETLAITEALEPTTETSINASASPAKDTIRDNELNSDCSVDPLPSGDTSQSTITATTTPTFPEIPEVHTPPLNARLNDSQTTILEQAELGKQLVRFS
jgi:hypothetical protein